MISVLQHYPDLVQPLEVRANRQELHDQQVLDDIHPCSTVRMSFTLGRRFSFPPDPFSPLLSCVVLGRQKCTPHFTQMVRVRKIHSGKKHVPFVM